MCSHELHSLWYKIINKINKCINSDLSRIHDWFAANKLTLSMTKTKFLHIGTRQRLSNLSEKPNTVIDGISVEQVSSSKSLGVQVDENLNWVNHVDMISKRISSGISAIKPVRLLVPLETLFTISNGLVQPHSNYCSTVWGNCNKGLSDKLQILQNRAACIITFSNYYTNAGGLFRSLKWKTLDRQRKTSKLNKETLDYLSSKFVNRSDTISYSVREMGRKFAVPLPRTEHYKRSVSYRGAVMWDSLPSNLRQASSRTNLKSQISCNSFSGWNDFYHGVL